MIMWGEIPPETLGDHPDRIDLLFAALRFNQDMKSLSELRMALMTDPDALQSLVVTADRRMLLSALLACLQEKHLFEFDMSQSDPLLCQLASARSGFTRRRKVLSDGLAEIIKALNAVNIVPMLLKGSVSLWKSAPGWRFQRDIDFLVEPAQAAAAHETLLSIGFAPTAVTDRARHHMQPVLRDDLPASIEVHYATSHQRGEKHLPTREFVANCELSETEKGTVFLPGAIEHMLHMVVHSHFTNRNATYGVSSLKGLFEFAWHVENSTDQTVMLMYERAQQTPRLLAVVDLWFAAIESDFGVRLPGGLAVPADAILRWQKHRARMLQSELPSLLTAYREETKMIRARTNKTPDLIKAFWAPLHDILTAPILIDYCFQARKSAGIITQ
jgi:hypothetical protein